MNCKEKAKDGWYPLVILCFISVLLIACQNRSTFDEIRPVAAQGWAAKQPLEFSVPIQDAAAGYTLIVTSRHSYRYPLADLVLGMEVSAPEQDKKLYRIQLELAHPDGRWKGEGTGNLFSNEFQVARHYQFPDTGVYLFRLYHEMQMNPLPGIKDLGLRVIREP